VQLGSTWSAGSAPSHRSWLGHLHRRRFRRCALPADDPVCAVHPVVLGVGCAEGKGPGKGVSDYGCCGAAVAFVNATLVGHVHAWSFPVRSRDASRFGMPTFRTSCPAYGHRAAMSHDPARPRRQRILMNWERLFGGSVRISRAERNDVPGRGRWATTCYKATKRKLGNAKPVTGLRSGLWWAHANCH
jgi:hypothetical protein